MIAEFRRSIRRSLSTTVARTSARSTHYLGDLLRRDRKTIIRVLCVAGRRLVCDGHNAIGRAFAVPVWTRGRSPANRQRLSAHFAADVWIQQSLARPGIFSAATGFRQPDVLLRWASGTNRRRSTRERRQWRPKRTPAVHAVESCGAARGYDLHADLVGGLRRSLGGEAFPRQPRRTSLPGPALERALTFEDFGSCLCPLSS